jgi:putative membrane protein
MTNFRSIGRLALLAGLSASLAGACSDDDDDMNNNLGGSAGTSQAGRTNGEGGTSQAGRTNGEAGKTTAGGQTNLPSSAGAPGSGGASAGANQGGAAGNAEAGAAGMTAALSDAQILLVLDTLNQGEVDEAYAVLPRLSSSDVKTFAQEMVTDHGDGRQAVAVTADSLNEAPAPSAEEATLKGEAESHVAMLRAASTASLDATYIGLEVTGHQEALALLDELAAVARADALNALITTLRATVQQHLERAQALQAAL